MRLTNAFTEHPASVDETYFEHMRVAFSFGLPLLGAALACMVHALAPFLFVKTGSSTVRRLYERMNVNRKAIKADCLGERANAG